MNKLTTTLLCAVILSVSLPASAQLKTVQEMKDYMMKYKWMLRRLEHNGQFYTAPKDQQGSRMVFLNNGKMYIYKPGESESSAERMDWTITKDRMVLTTSKGVRNEFKFKLEEFIGYKIYATPDDGDDNPTYVWEEAEKIESPAATTTRTTTPSYSTGSTTSSGSSSTGGSTKGRTTVNVPANTSSPQWLMVFAKGVNPGLQSWMKRVDFPARDIETKWKDGYFITDISPCDGEDNYFLTFAKTGYKNQAWEKRATMHEAITVVKNMWNDESKYDVTHLSFVNNEWIIIGSEGAPLTEQFYFYNENEFPLEKVKEQWGNGHDITTMAYGKGGWLVIMSKGMNYKDQRYKKFTGTWKNDEAYEILGEGYVLAHVYKQGNEWHAIFNKDTKITSVSNKQSTSLPSKTEITDHWEKGFSIYKSIYIPGR